jgi:hypothetical protein
MVKDGIKDMTSFSVIVSYFDDRTGSEQDLIKWFHTEDEAAEFIESLDLDSSDEVIVTEWKTELEPEQETI